MARRKQNQPSRNTSKVTSEIDKEEPLSRDNGNGLSTDNADGGTVASSEKQMHIESGRVIYSSISLRDYVIDVAEMNIQAVVYECGMLNSEGKCLIDQESLEVRLRLPNLLKDSIVDLHALSQDDVKVEVFVRNHNRCQGLDLDQETGESSEILLSGYMDGPKDCISGIVYLFKAGFVCIKPCIQLKSNDNIDTNGISCSLRVGITEKAFDSSKGLLDGAKSLWSRNMQKVMKCLRPDLHTGEAVYGIPECDVSHFTGRKAISEQAFDSSALYEAIRPDQNGVVSYRAPSQLRVELRPYQCRAANWMISRENVDTKLAFSNGRWPFCLKVLSIDGKSIFYYNPFR